jgi:hypothetical protein
MALNLLLATEETRFLAFLPSHEQPFRNPVRKELPTARSESVHSEVGLGGQTHPRCSTPGLSRPVVVLGHDSAHKERELMRLPQALASLTRFLAVRPKALTE